MVTASIYAQNLQVTGTVTDAITGDVVPFASVQIKGTSTGTATDDLGQYSINVPKNGTLVFSFIGYLTQEVPVNGRAVINASISPDAEALDEVLVVAYGTASKQDFTGSATALRTAEIVSGSNESLEKALAGKISGVRMGVASGDPGSSATITIRGVGSINSKVTPLYVIDGVPIESEASTRYTSSTMMSTLNNDDIESITILKDAAASSLYGSRAANGVVIITTKRGKIGETSISYSGEAGINQIANKKAIELADAGEYKEFFITAKNNANKDGQAYYDAWYPDAIDNAHNTDWGNEIFRTGIIQNHQVSLNSGNEKSRVYASVGYTDNEGIGLGSSFTRLSARVNADFTVNKWFKVGVKQMVSQTNQEGPSGQANQVQGMANASYMGILLGMNPASTVYNEDGTYYNYPSLVGSRAPNPYSHFEGDDYWNKAKAFRSLSNVDLTVTFFEGLDWTTNAAYDYYSNQYDNWWSPDSGDGAALGGLGQIVQENRTSTTASSLLKFNRTFNEKHSINALAGFELSDNMYSYVSASANSYSTSKLPHLSNGQPYDTGGSASSSGLLSFLANVNYSYDSKYYLSGSFRRDGSSRLGADNRWANFWSVSGAWRMSQEGFMEGNPLFADFKLKASYGTNGNLPLNYYDYLGQYATTGGYGTEAGIYWYKPNNNELGWEKSSNFNVGIEWNMYSRVTLGVEYYNKYTESLIFDMPSSYVTGFNKYTTNVGNLSNTGLEVELHSVNVRTNDFTWNTSFNFTWQQTLVDKLPNGDDVQYGDGNMYLLREGESIHSFYLPVYLGVNDETGLAEFWKDPNDHSQGVVNYYTEAKPTVVGKGIPDIIGGITNTFKYKNLDFSFMISYQFGGSIFDYPGYFLQHDGLRVDGMNIHVEALDYWTPENTDAYYPKPIDGNPYRSDRFSSRTVKSSDNIRMREIALGYNFRFKKHVDNLRVYVRANNPFMIWSATPTIDPDVPINGYRTADTPVAKSFVIGLNITL